MNWTDFSNLNASQQGKLAETAAIGTALASTPTPDISTVAHSQAKAAKAFLTDLQLLTNPAVRGVSYILEVRRAAAIQAFEDANP